MKLFLVYFVLLILSSTKLFAEKSDEINPILQREQETFERSIVRRIYEMAMLDHDLYPERAKEMRKLLVMINNQNIRELFENTKRSFEEKDWPTYQENQILLIEKLQNLVNHMQSGELSSFKDQKERERFLLSQYNLGETLEAKHYFSLKAFIEQLELNIDWHSWILSEWENLDITNKICDYLETNLDTLYKKINPENIQNFLNEHASKATKIIAFTK